MSRNNSICRFLSSLGSTRFWNVTVKSHLNSLGLSFVICKVSIIQQPHVDFYKDQIIVCYLKLSNKAVVSKCYTHIHKYMISSRWKWHLKE